MTMRLRVSALLLIVLGLSTPCRPGAAWAQAGSSSFPSTFEVTLAEKKRTSAGVFTPEGRLIKTLWSGVERAAGKHAGRWDWTDDSGRLVPDGAYQVKVLSNSFSYAWEGVLGNTSREKSGP